MSAPANVARSPEWHDQRREGIGSSDAPAILGLSRHSRPIDIYLEKIGEAEGEREDTTFTEWGRRLEPVLAQAAEDAINVGREGDARVRFTQWTAPMRCRQWARAFSHLDRRGKVDGEMVALECKSGMGTRGWGDPCIVSIADAHEVIPADYAVQVGHHLLCTGYPAVYVAALIGYRDFRLYRVERDADWMADLLADEREFWALVEARTPPDPDGSDAYGAYLGRRARALGKAEAKSPTPNQQLKGNNVAVAKVAADSSKVAYDLARQELDLSMAGTWALTHDRWKAYRVKGKRTIGWETVAATQRRLIERVHAQDPEVVVGAVRDEGGMDTVEGFLDALLDLYTKTGDPYLKFELVAQAEEE